jgi:hypothetical protein
MTPVPTAKRLLRWVHDVYQPAVERKDRKVRLPEPLLGFRALLYRAAGAAQALAEHQRAEKLEDELGGFDTRVNRLIDALDDAVGRGGLPLAVRLAIEQLEELVQ